VFRSVTRLWLPEQSSKQLQARGDTALDILASDFYQAVADVGIVPDGGGTTNNPGFVLDCPMLQPESVKPTDTQQVVLQMIIWNAQLYPDSSTLNSPQIVLYFARHALPRTPISAGEALSQRLSLDAVFYVCYSNCLSRHVYPLVRNTWDDNADDTVSTLLDKRKRDLIGDLAPQWYHGGPPPPAGQHSLLADRCDFAALVTLAPTALNRNPLEIAPLPKPPDFNSTSLAFFWQCEAFAVPEFLDVALVLYTEADWNMRTALQGNTTPQAEMKREYIGTKFSKRITFPAKKGAR